MNGFVPLGGNRFRIPADSRWFDGHFDGAPILPGIAQIALAVSLFGSTVRGVRDVRFRRPLGPNDELEVIFSDAGRFEIRSGDGIATAGMLVVD